MYANKILVGLDGSANSALALRWAVSRAAASAAEIQAVHAYFVPVLAYSAPGFIPPEQQDAELQAKTFLAKALEAIAPEDAAKVGLRVVEGYPPDALAREAEEPDVAMVVIGARGHGKMEEIFLGSVSHALTHRCHKPMVIVPRSWTGGNSRVVVGVSGSPGSIPALRWAADYVRRCSTALEVVTVSRPSGGRSDDRLHASTLLSNALSQIDTTGVTVTTTVVTDGQPADVLITRAADADLLVVGTRGLGRFHEALTGSVTHACAEHSPVPVAIIRDYPPADG